MNQDINNNQQKPPCQLIGADGNIFNLMGIASRTLKGNHLNEQAKEMRERIMASGSYDEALCIIGDYVEMTSKQESVLDELMDEDFDMSQEMQMDM